MAKVRVGDVRREKPREVLGHRKRWYVSAPFRVVAIDGWSGTSVTIGALDGCRQRSKSFGAVARCPLWPSEHDKWKDAQGYEVKDG